MKKTILKISVFILVFFIALFVVGKIMNEGNNNLTMEIAPAEFPLVTMELGEVSYNQLHGYRNAMDVAFQRETFTELETDRHVSFSVDPYGQTVNGISVEVRSADGKRLVENSPVTDLIMRDGRIYAGITLKDLIEQDTEYALVILLDMGEDDIIRYYTRIICSENMYAEEKLAFVTDFHRKLYDKEAAKELTPYLESSPQGDNSTFHKVNIHSSFKQVTWGDLSVTEETQPAVRLTELANQTASVHLDYVVSTPGGKKKVYYMVDEYYRVRYTPDRMYLLDYERTMTQIPDVGGDIYANDKILLGIVGEDFLFQESEDGNIVIFEAAGRLCSYNATTNKLAVLFSFYDEKNGDARTMYPAHAVKILDVDEGGSVRFAVYGYMNRGRHEGEVGTQIYYYDSGLNTVEEAVWLPYTKSFRVLEKEMEQLLYMNRGNKLYLFLENTVYGIDLLAKQYERIVTVARDESIQVSANHKILVWQEGDDIYRSGSLMVKNLNTGRENTIKAGNGEAIRPLGFMKEDIIYGVARLTDVTTDSTGRVFFPMYKVCIQNSEGELLKEESQENIYVTDCIVEENQIRLERLERGADGVFREAEEGYIINNVVPEEGTNKVVTVNIDTYGNYVEIQTTKNIDPQTFKVLTPKEVVFEGGRELALAGAEEDGRCYVYGPYGISGIFNDPASAVKLAYETSGVVVNGEGAAVWKKGNRAVRNQIMAITEDTATPERSSLAVCLDAILKFRGIVRDSQAMLDQGKTVMEILGENLEGTQVLNLSGCSLDAVLYYVNRELPVLAILENGEAVLVTGFNEFNVVIMDPVTGKLEKRGMNDSGEWFAENGNCFITFIDK